MWPVIFRFVFWSALLLSLLVALLPQPLQVGASDKVQHAAAFAALSVVGLLAYPLAAPWKLGAGLAAFGLLIEILQALPAVGRHADPVDWLADVLGILAILLALTLGRTWIGRSRRSS